MLKLENQVNQKPVKFLAYKNAIQYGGAQKGTKSRIKKETFTLELRKTQQTRADVSILV